MMMMLGLLGSVLSLVGLIWIVVIAFQNGDIVWGIVSIFCGIAAIIYGVQHMEQAKIPLGMLVAGIILSVVGNVAGGAGRVQGNLDPSLQPSAHYSTVL
ncbi:hypothetical protein ETAA8_11690 [Anatilimnocola aggregata]|uniref:Uncharacterized protein n=1 Tax=Anatilimnocola aggregata TaxID=2528021 RepID=A0A517Y7B1_9BACT|nr:hypothetical protein [Anatilimnocola aggregata]QDU26095.1 hypothetical protein ETAA8_11690 [Anatilimnocola aggregata]